MLQFQIDFPVFWIIILGTLLLVVTGWLEIKRHQKFIVLRLIAVVIAIVSIIALIVKPSVLRHKTSDYILLTMHYNPRIVDSLSEEHSGIQLYHLHDVEAPKRSTLIDNYRNLSDLRGNIHLVGDGVPAYMLDYLDTSALHYYPSTLPEGFTNINLRKQYKQHQLSTIEGIFHTKEKNFKLKLTGSGQVEDSLTVTENIPQPFALKFTPKASGNFVYTLTATDSSGELVYSERVPIQVTEQKPLSILILNDFPTAEIRFLKNYLEAEKHQLTLRYGISKNTYRTEFINTTNKKAVTLTRSALSNVDLVILDAGTLASLSENQKRELKQATQNGLGIITLLNDPTSAVVTKTNHFLELRSNPFKSDTAAITLSTGKVKMPATPLQLETNTKIFPILVDQSHRIIAGYQHYGLGKLGFQLLHSTYGLQLGGQKENYAVLWSNLLDETARQESQQHSINVNTTFPVYPDEPLHFEIISATEKPEVKFDSTQLSLLESKLVSNVWQANTWAGNPGWNILTVDDQNFSVFVSNDKEWNSMRVANQQQLLTKLSGGQLSSTQQIVYQPIAPIIFYLTFLVAAGFLWLAPKL